MGYLKKIIHFITMLIATLMTMTTPMEINHGTDNCCATCQLKKEDEIELTEEQQYNDEK
tara:strand:- start:4607 stop:4783 length:177 start_codon:yes stop_codon:yes gene_type:complete